ncbi:MAG: ATP-binding protein [Thermodesulfobacteriota bacterium]|nr:ATP-binding protein [Thermodesulfobacteriota bacterium]
MLKNKSLKYRLILSGIVCICVPFILSGIIIYSQLSGTLLDMAKDKSMHTVEDASIAISTALQQEMRLASSMAADPGIVDACRTDDYQLAEQKIDAVYRRIGKNFFTIFIIDKQGIDRADARFKNQVGLDLSDRAYFLDAKKGRTTVVGPLKARGDTPLKPGIIIVSSPVMENSEFYGAVCLAFDRRFFRNIYYFKRQYQEHAGISDNIFLINHEGKIVFHHEESLFSSSNFFDHPGTGAIKKISETRQTGITPYHFDGTQMLAGISHINLTDWIVVFAQSRNAIMAPVNRLLTVIFVCMLLFLIITIVSIVIISGRISSPIQKMIRTFTQATQYSSEMIALIGIDRKIFFVNAAFERIVGQKSDAIIGTEPQQMLASAVDVEEIWGLLEAGDIWAGRVTLAKSADTEKACIELMILPLRDEKGTILGYLEIGRDITSEVLAEKKLLQSQKLESIGTLAGGIAHDFNNILGGIFGFSQLLLMDNKCDAETKSYLEEILKAAERARTLVQQILTFGRKVETEFKPLLPQVVIKEALQLLRATIPATIDIQKEFKSNAAIMADPGQIHQVILNLCTNAAHAIGDNKGTIRVVLEDFGADDAFVSQHAGMKTGKHLLLRISDTGCGISPEALDQIFDPFFTTKSTGEGTGLGLSVVHGIVKNMGGTITVYSEVGKGTTFNVIVPCIEQNDVKARADEATLLKGTGRVVVVDDEPALVDSMESILSNLGYTVTPFTSGLAAMEAVKSGPEDTDVIISDTTMPGITGFEIVKDLRQAGIHIPVILTSGYFGENMETFAAKEGVCELLAKPVTAYQLAQAVHNALNRRTC